MDGNLPVGFLLSISQNEKALKYFANLDNISKNKISNYIRDSIDGNEAKERINISLNGLENNNLNFLN